MPAVLPVPAESATPAVAGWGLREFAEVTSTNTVAAALPAWSAVRARIQTAGRGRTGRAWVSDDGGLWLSAVVPTPAGPDWALLPLAAGRAVLTTVRELGIAGARLRWPNDIMVGRDKLAGILVDRYSPATAVIGVGLNVANRPGAVDAALADGVTRLADLLPDPPAAAELLPVLLTAVRREHRRLAAGRSAGLIRDLNHDWRQRRPTVALTVGNELVRGRFAGVDTRGRLRLLDASGRERVFPAHQVDLLREIL